MLKIIRILIFFQLIFCANVNAQVSNDVPKTGSKYYLFISGINSKSDVKSVEKNIRSHEVVTFFLGDRFPVEFFTLITSVAVTKEKVVEWLHGTNYKLVFFGEGEEMKEAAAMFGKKYRKQ